MFQIESDCQAIISQITKINTRNIWHYHPNMIIQNIILYKSSKCVCQKELVLQIHEREITINVNERSPDITCVQDFCYLGMCIRLFCSTPILSFSECCPREWKVLVNLVSPMGLDWVPLSRTYFESVFPQLVTVLQLPCDNAHVNVDTPANKIDYLLCIFLFF